MEQEINAVKTHLIKNRFLAMIFRFYNAIKNLIFKTTASQKFAQQRSGWNFVSMNRYKIFQKFEQTVRFGIFLAILRHIFNNRFCLFTQHSKLEQQSGIEHHIGIFLERENPFFFTAPYTWPATDGFARCETTKLVVAHNSPQKAGVGSWNPIVVIERNSCQCKTYTHNFASSGIAEISSI